MLEAARAVSGPLAVALGAIVIGAAMTGAGLSVYHLMSTHMQTWPAAAIANAVIVSAGPLMLAAGAVQAKRERTRAMLGLWLFVWCVAALALASLDGVLSSGAVAVGIDALTMIGQILAPVPSALMVVTAAAVALTLRGDDNPGALGDYLLNILKGVAVGFSSLGLANFARAQGVTDGAYVAAFAIVVETALITLLAYGKRGRLVNGLTWLFALLIGANSTEVVATVFHIPLSGALAILPEIGKAAILLSGMSVIGAVAALAMTKHATPSGPGAIAWATQRAGELAEMRATVGAALGRAIDAPTPSPAIALSKDASGAELVATNTETATAGAGAEVRPATPKRRARAGRGGVTQPGH
jgi:hypothetical protein